MKAIVIDPDERSINYVERDFADFKEIQKELLRLFNETALLICEGQQLDLDFEQKNDIDYENYLKMIKYKTAVLLA